jgi:PAS domain S-box-containing protein
MNNETDDEEAIGARAFQAMVENSRDLLIHIGSNGRINFASSSAQEILDWPPADLKGKQFSDIIEFETPAAAEEFLKQLRSSENRLQGRAAFLLNKAGDEVPVEIRWANFSTDPDINGIVLRCQDMRQRRIQEQEQRYNRELFTAAFRVNNAMCSITDPVTGRFLDVNDVWVETMGHSREATIGNTSVGLSIWGTSENRQHIIDKLAQEGSLKNFETNIFNARGEKMIVTISAETLVIGGVERLFFSSTDVTEDRKQAAVLRESEARFRDIAEYSSDWFWELDENYRYEFVSQGSGFIDDFDHNDLLGKTVEEFLANLGMQEKGARLQWALRHHRSFKNTRVMITPPKGETSYHEFSGKPLFDEAGNFTGYRGTGTNVTAKVQAEEKRLAAEEYLRQAQKMEVVGQLTGGIAHDFNNLLSVILGNAEMLEDIPDNKIQVEAIKRAATRGAELTGSLLAFSRKQVLSPTIFRLDKQLQPLISILPRTLGETIRINTQSRGDLWDCYADPGQMENALLNLSINARDAMPDGGTMTIMFDNTVRAEGDFVSMTVVDTGKGMTDEVRKRSLEPFFTTKGVGAGTGLGLSMVYGFVEQSGGHLSIASEIDGGTSVELCLPRAPQ